MGITERRERERQEVRGKILEAARALFVAHGYDAVTMRKVAEAIEYSPTTIYLHFKDKEELIRCLCAEDYLALAKAFQRIGREKDPIERIRKAGNAYVQFGLDHPAHYQLMFMRPHPEEAEACPASAAGSVHGAQTPDPGQDAFAFLLAAVQDAMAQGRLREELTDPLVVAQALWANVHGVVSLHLLLADDPKMPWKGAKAISKVQIDAGLRGICRAPEGGR